MADGRPTIDWSKFVAPLVLGLAALGLWEGLVRGFKIPPYLLPGPILILQTLVTDWQTLMESWWITMSHLDCGAHRGGRARRGAGGDVRRVEMDRALVLSLCRRAAGDADRGDRAADHHLGQRRQAVAADLRLDRRLLPDPVEHHGRPQFGRPQSGRSVPPLPRQRAGSRCAISSCPPRCPISWRGCASRAACR